MLLWIGFAVLAAAVVWAVTRPLLADDSGTAAANDFELAVYRDRLAEIDAERAQGLLAATKPKAPASSSPAGSSSARKQSSAAAKLLPVPARRVRGKRSCMPPRLCRSSASRCISQSARRNFLPAPTPPASMRRPTRRLLPIWWRASRRTCADLEDGRGWDVLAPVYLRMGDYTQAADAFQKAARLLGEFREGRLGGDARALIMLQNGVVNEPARQAYSRLLSLEPQSLLAQGCGSPSRAASRTADLKGGGSRYRTCWSAPRRRGKGSLREARWQAVTERLGGPAAPQVAPQDPPAAGPAIRRSVSGRSRQVHRNKMVEGLAARLKDNGKDLEGWMRLLRSYMVLGAPRRGRGGAFQRAQSIHGRREIAGRAERSGGKLGAGLMRRRAKEAG